MCVIIQLPLTNKFQNSDLEQVIERELEAVPMQDREKLRFELIKTIDSYDPYFTQWTLTLSENVDETLKKQIYDIAHQEHDRKMNMLADIIKLKIQVLVAEYNQW